MYRSIIYIWYDDGVLTPSLVPKRRASSFWWACQAAATVDGRERSRRKSHMKGGITDNGEESQGREEEGW